MHVDKGGFLALTAALAGGGVVGYLVADRNAPPKQVVDDAKPAVVAPAPPTEEETKKAAAAKAKEERLAALAKCDDSVGAAEECPAGLPDSTGEGMCGEGGSWAAKRCADFKAHFKPKVAQAAVACLRSLKGAEQCDKERVDLCGHQALMTACQEEMPTEFLGASSTVPASFEKDAEPLTGVAKQCDEIVKSCGQSAPASYAECMHTLSGMNETGRTAAASCMKLHCGDKGFIGCEAAPTTLTAKAPPIQ
jgi:hypothetical protein